MQCLSTTVCPARCHTVSRGTALRSQRPAAPRATTRSALVVRAAIPNNVPPTPMGLPSPNRVPKGLQPRYIGFYDASETINGRAAMIGLFALCLIEGVFNTGLLDIMGVQTGNGINLGF